MIQNHRKNNDEKFIICFLTYIVMSTTTLQNLKLRFQLYVEK